MTTSKQLGLSDKICKLLQAFTSKLIRQIPASIWYSYMLVSGKIIKKESSILYKNI